MIQIIAGKLKGRKLKTPSTGTRPTSAKVREALFNILGPLDGVRFLDLFAGSGAIGLEAYSRGATEVVLVEKNPQAARLIKENIETTKTRDSVHLKNAEVLKAVRQLGAEEKRFEIIFIDPPYSQGWVEKCLEAIQSANLLTPEGLILAEESSRVDLPDALSGYGRIKSYKYGDTALHIFKLPRHPEGGRDTD